MKTNKSRGREVSNSADSGKLLKKACFISDCESRMYSTAMCHIAPKEKREGLFKLRRQSYKEAAALLQENAVLVGFG